jgi:subtilase family serine protease
VKESIGRLTVLLVSIMFISPLASVAATEEKGHARGLPDFAFKAGSNRTIPVVPVFGDDVWFFITVLNLGDADYEGSYVIGFWLCWTGDPETSIGLTPTENDADMRDLEAGGSVEVNLVFKTLALGPGNHTITVVVDDENLIAEGNETNNQIDIDYPIAPPDPMDLTIPTGGLSVEQPSPLAGDEVRVNATVLNNGPGFARYADVFFYMDDTNHSIANREILTNISASDSATASVMWSTRGLPPGTYTLMAFIHPVWAIDWMANDSDTSNNNATLLVTLGKPNVDIQLNSFAISPERPVLGDMLNVSINISNKGTGTWVEVPVNLSLDQIPVSHQQVELLKHDAAMIEVPLDTSDLAEREHTLRLVAVNLDTELNFTLAVLKPDLVPMEMTWLPVLPAAGDDVCVTVKVANLGAVASPECNITIYWTVQNSTSSVTARLPGILPGRWTRQNLTWDSAEISPGSHILRVMVDPEGSVAEENRSNNEMLCHVDFSGNVDLALGNLTISPPAPVQGETASFSVRTTNLGSLRLSEGNVTLRVGGRLVDIEALGAILAGGSANSTLSWSTSGFALGSYNYELEASVTGGQGDDSPANNRLTGQLQLLPPAPRPDLMVAWTGVPVLGVRAGNALVFDVGVDNTGNKDANASSMAVSLETAAGGSFHFTNVSVPAVTAGSSIRVSVSVDTTALNPGKYGVNITLDYLNAIPEADETNNHVSREVMVLEAVAATPQLRVVNVRLSGSLEDGKTVVIRADVSNTGDADAAGVFVEFIIDGKVKATRTIDTIARNGTGTCALDWTVSKGQHTIRVVVSAKGSYGVAGQLPVTVSGTDSAHQMGAVVLGTTIMLMALIATMLAVHRPRRPQTTETPRAEEE